MTHVLTRSLGASLADLLSQSKEYGGVGLGTAKTSILFFIVIIFISGFLTFKKNKIVKTKSGLKP